MITASVLKGLTMHIFLWAFIWAALLSNSEHLLFKDYTASFIYVGQKRYLMMMKQESYELYPVLRHA